MQNPAFGSHVLAIDAAAEARRIASWMEEIVVRRLRRRGVVVGLSGGVDSSVVAALAVRALGAGRVLALLMPEHHSSPESTDLGRKMADSLGVEAIVAPIGPALEALGCYAEQRAAIRGVFSDYGEGWRCKVVLPPLAGGERINVFSLVVESPDGRVQKARLPADAYRRLVAATNMKQRTRKQIEYFHADARGFAVAGTPNRLEYDQGFFVKNGDGAADLKPIAHLYKIQVYALAEHLGVPAEIRSRPPTTDTWSMAQTQDEFYFALPWQAMDLCLWGKSHDVPEESIADLIELPVNVVEAVYRDIEQKRRTTRYLHEPPLLVEELPELRRADEER